MKREFEERRKLLIRMTKEDLIEKIRKKEYEEAVREATHLHYFYTSRTYDLRGIVEVKEMERRTIGIINLIKYIRNIQRKNEQEDK